MLELRGISKPVPLSNSHPTISYGPVVGIDSVELDMHTEQAHSLGVVLLVSLAWVHHIAFLLQ